MNGDDITRVITFEVVNKLMKNKIKVKLME